MAQPYIGSGNFAPQGKIEEYEQPDSPWTAYADRDVTDSPFYPTGNVNVPPSGVDGSLEGEEYTPVPSSVEADVGQVSDDDPWAEIKRTYELSKQDSPVSRIGSAAAKLIHALDEKA